MKRPSIFLAAFSAVTLTASCGTSLYYWGGGSMSGASRYEDLTYRNYDRRTPESICDLLCLYADMVTHPGGERKVPPPGICAEFGYLLLQPDTEEIFASHATERQKSGFAAVGSAPFPVLGKRMIEKEMTLYPESATFLRPLLDKFTEDWL